ncbi:MAG: membrane protein insertion efficiency factor YidD [Sediminibacterium sp.]|nr:membrane protein insertion efficiency factor YidD [Sediminibacterium sp.]
MKIIWQILSIPFIGVIKFYQYVISPALGPKCRFTPTCSHYAVDALKKYGLFKGMYLSIIRISKCRPGGGHGYDVIYYTKKLR